MNTWRKTQRSIFIAAEAIRADSYYLNGYARRIGGSSGIDFWVGNKGGSGANQRLTVYVINPTSDILVGLTFFMIGRWK